MSQDALGTRRPSPRALAARSQSHASASALSLRWVCDAPCLLAEGGFSFQPMLPLQPLTRLRTVLSRRASTQTATRSSARVRPPLPVENQQAQSSQAQSWPTVCVLKNCSCFPGFVVDAKLTPSTVPSLQLQFQWPVDGAVYAQVRHRSML